MALFKALGDKRAAASALVYLGNLVIDQGEYTRARRLLEDSLEMNKELGDTTGLADSLFDLARLCYVSGGDLTQAHTWLEESLALYRELGDKESIAYYLQASFHSPLNTNFKRLMHLFGEPLAELDTSAPRRLNLLRGGMMCQYSFFAGGNTSCSLGELFESLSLHV